MRKRLTITLAIFFCLIALAPPTQGQPLEQPDAAELQQMINRLGVVGGALYVAAHPDDENTAMLAWLANEKLVRAGYLSVTRGDGGQNLIGPEKGELLGVIRTLELLEARRIDGAEQMFTRAIDFGYTKSADETHEIWGREAVLADVVWAIRTFRPDIIITRFPTDGSGGHGQHTSSAILAEEAFVAAGDPSRFPEQLAQVQPWSPRRLFWNNWRPDLEKRPADAPRLIPVDLGAYNPLLGTSYTELSARSRSMHKSQGFGSGERRGSLLNYFEQKLGDPARDDLFSGIDLTWNRVPGSERLRAILARAAETFDPSDPSAIVPTLLEARAEITKLPDTPDVMQKRRELDVAIRSAAGLWMEAITGEASASPGSTVKIATSIVNRSNIPMTLERIEVPFGDAGVVSKIELLKNRLIENAVSVTLPEELSYSGPYWLRDWPKGNGGGAGAGLYKVADQTLVGQPQSTPPIQVSFEVTIGGQRFQYTVPAQFRWVDRVEGDQYRPFEVAPPVTVTFLENVVIFPNPANKTIRVAVRSGEDGFKGTLRLKLPPGWGSKPEVEDIALSAKGDEKVVTFAVAPPQGSTRTQIIGAEIASSGKTFDRSRVEISYPHFPRQTIFFPAEATVVRSDIRTGGERVGYVMGPGDDVPGVLEQIGYDVRFISDEELAAGDLSRFDTIISGVRAYNTRAALKLHHRRLMEFVENGGTYIVQYNTADSTLAPEIGPWPLETGRGRVSVESAPVTLLDSENTILKTPNRITPKDFDGWVQERGLYFASKWDPRYQTVIASADPGEENLAGGLLIGRHGKGIYIYTGYSWFRQLPAGVEGAIRMFANLVSAD